MFFIVQCDQCLGLKLLPGAAEGRFGYRGNGCWIIRDRFKKLFQFIKDKKHDRNVAIGVGLAAVAIAAVAAATKEQKKKQSPSSPDSFSYEEHVDRPYLEDECGEELV